MIFSTINFIFRKNELIAGIFFLIISFSGFLFPKESMTIISATIFGGAFYLGIILISDCLTLKLARFSILGKVLKSNKEKKTFYIFTSICGAIFSFIIADLGGLWYFPYWSTTDYFIIAYILCGWEFYILSLVTSFTLVKILLDKYILQKKHIRKYYKYEKYLYLFLLIVGIICFGIVGIETLIKTNFFINFQFIINQPKPAYIDWYYWLIGFVGLVFVCEFIEYKRKRTSLFKDILHGYYNPLITCFVVGTILALLNEVQNFDVFLWKYNNYPFHNITIFNVPIFIIIAWSIQMIALIESWRAFGTNTSKTVFEDDMFIK